MTELFLKKEGEEWQQVFFEASNGFKLTRENPYFTQSESYTLDVTFPMAILQNRRFFQNIQRKEHTKTAASMKCRLTVNNRMVLDGSAKITQVTEKQVKVQLLGGNSEINFLSAENKTYIDEMPLGGYETLFYFTDYNDEIHMSPEEDGLVTYMPTYDETNGRMMNRRSYSLSTQAWNMVISREYNNFAMQPNLLYIVKGVIALSGFTLERCDFDCEPWDKLFVASAKTTNHMAHALPHWLVKDFIKEVCRFFNCTLIVDSYTKSASFINNAEIFNSASRIKMNPIDEYTSEMTEDDGEGKVLAASNIEYSLSSSEGHGLDCISDGLRNTIPRKDCSDKSDALAQYEALDATERLRYLYVCPTGKFVGWTKGEGTPEFMKIDHFAPLVRQQESSSSIELKICPVALMESLDALWYGTPDSATPRMRCIVASLENPTGPESRNDNGGATAQDLIEGNAETAEKEDRLQVMFVDNQPQVAIVAEGDNAGVGVPILMPFTDCDLLHQGNLPHSSWSLSLNRTDAVCYLGQMHSTDFTFNTKGKTIFKFIADRMPDPKAVFVIGGKEFACEKIEASVTERGFSKLMTGYFYEKL